MKWAREFYEDNLFRDLVRDLRGEDFHDRVEAAFMLVGLVFVLAFFGVMVSLAINGQSHLLFYAGAGVLTSMVVTAGSQSPGSALVLIVLGVALILIGGVPA